MAGKKPKKHLRQPATDFRLPLLFVDITNIDMRNMILHACVKTVFCVLAMSAPFISCSVSGNDVDRRIVSMIDSARFYESAGMEEVSMKWYLQADQLADESCSDTLRGRLYYSMARIYDDVLMDAGYANPYYEKASEYFMKGKDTLMYVVSQLAMAENMMNDGRLEEVSSILDEAVPVVSGNPAVKPVFDIFSARYAAILGNKSEARRILDLYVSELPSDSVDWLYVTDVLLTLGDSLSGKAAFDSASVYISRYEDDPLFYILKSEICSFGGHRKEALDAYVYNLTLKDSLEKKARQSYAKYINERHVTEMAIARNKGVVRIVSASIILLISLIIFIIVILKKSKDEHASLSRKEKEVKSKIDELKTEIGLLEVVAKRKSLDSPELQELIDGRLRILENCMASIISSDDDGAVEINRILDEVKSDRMSFQNSLRLTFGITDPGFIEYLEKKGLSNEQINICCLYAIGMSGKEIMNYTAKKRTYNESIDIRAKLGLGKHDTNLGKYIREIVGAVCLSIVLLTGGCSEDNHVDEQLNRVSGIIHEFPDSALELLNEIPDSCINTSRLRARYAVLLSMAYDKNRIDIADDSLISIAVDYYRYHGTADDKIKTYYYRGNTSLNRYDYKSAIEDFLRAEKYADRAKDQYAVALLYNTSAYVYVKIKDTKAIYYYRKSADAFYREGDTNRAVRSLLYQVIVCDECGYDSIRNASMAEIEQMKNIVDKEYLHQYYGIKINEAISSCDTQAVKGLFDEYFKVYGNEEFIDWGNVAKAQMFLGNYREAIDAWSLFKTQFSPAKLNTEYYYCYIRLAQIYDSLGLYDKALQEYTKYGNLNDSITQSNIASDTKYLKERNENELMLKKARYRTIFISILGFALAVIVSGMIYTYILRRRKIRSLKKEIERDKMDLEEMQRELDKYKSESSKVNEDKMKMICMRLETINDFIAKSLTFKGNPGRKIKEEIDGLAKDRNGFIKDLFETFTITHSGLIAFLEGKGLTKDEMFICCLYAVGLHGKDIMAFFGRKRHYIDSSVIRSKLGLSEHDMNLGKYIKSIC